MTTAEFIAGFERFSSHTYWDVNAFRLGFGSDTEGPDQIPVTQGMVTTEARAIQNLALRIAKFQMETVLDKHVGIETWNKLTDNQKSAITSVVYNYGRLPSRVVIDLSNPGKTADSIRALQADNGGINHARRNKEADLYLAAVAGQPGQPVPLPKTQVPQVPVPVHVPSAPPAAPPSIPASWAARLAIELNQLLSLQTSYRAEFPTPFDEAITALQKLGTVPPSPLPLQIPAANSAAQPQGIQTVFGIKNWKTTLGGLAAILTAAGTGIHAFQSGDLSAAYESIPAILAGLALIGAKDNNVTGGSVPQTPEAQARATTQTIK
jgi:GH24 family phage-related lysozyme (muramidase)